MGSGRRTNVNMRGRLTDGSGKPNAEQNMIAKRAAQPSPRRSDLGSLKKGFEMRGPQTAPTGFVTTELGMNRKAIMRMKNHAQIVCTILTSACGPLSAPVIWLERSDTPTVPSSRKDSCRDPPPEDQEGKTTQDEGAELEVILAFFFFTGFDIGFLAGSQNHGVSNRKVLF